MSQEHIAIATAQRYGLSELATRDLVALAVPQPSASSMRLWFWHSVSALAAALGGLGVILWIAANWGDLSRMGKFALLQMMIDIFALGAAVMYQRRSPVQTAGTTPMVAAALGLVALLCTGALFAYFGQTYQTGADPWQLFALWAVLALPLCWALRHELLWTPWAIISMAGISLWLQTHAERSWRVNTETLPVHLAAWAVAAAVVIFLSQMLRRFTGAGVWSFRMALTLWLVGMTIMGVWGLFDRPIAPQYAFALVMTGLGCAVFAPRKMFDVYALSAVALCLIVLLISGMARMMLYDSQGNWFGVFLLLGLLAAGMLSAAVKLIMGLSKQYALQDMHEGAQHG
jgi:uncharacterized membrane protein